MRWAGVGSFETSCLKNVGSGSSPNASRAIGGPLPEPRYVDVDGARFTRRASCCLLYRVPHEAMCTSCPHRDPATRQVLLEDTAERMG